MFAIVISAAIAGCTSGAMAPLPKVATPAKATDVVIIRQKSLLGVANTFELTLDNRKIYGIRSGQYVRFAVDSGPHTFGVRCFGGWTFWWHTYKLSRELAPSTTEYFLVRPGRACAVIEAIDANTGRGYEVAGDYENLSAR